MNRMAGAEKGGRGSRVPAPPPTSLFRVPFGRAEATTEPEFEASGTILALLGQTSPLRALQREFQALPAAGLAGASALGRLPPAPWSSVDVAGPNLSSKAGALPLVSFLDPHSWAQR